MPSRMGNRASRKLRWKFMGQFAGYLLRHKGLELMEFCRWEVDGASCSSQPRSVHAEELWFKVTGLKAEDDVLV